MSGHRLPIEIAIGIAFACLLALEARAELLESAVPRERARELARRAVDRATADTDDDRRVALAAAITLTKQAHELDPDPLYLCNIGGFYRLLQDWPRAHSFLGRCLQLLPASRPDEVARFRAVLDEVEREVATDHVAILINVEPDAALVEVSTFARDEAVAAPALVWLPVGRHTVRTHVHGRPVRERVVWITAAMLANRARRVVAIDLAREPLAHAFSAAAPSRSAGRTRRLLGYTAIASGAAAVASWGLASYDGDQFRAFDHAAPVLAGVAVLASVGWFSERGKTGRATPVVGIAPTVGGGMLTMVVVR